MTTLLDYCEYIFGISKWKDAAIEFDYLYEYNETQDVMVMISNDKEDDFIYLEATPALSHKRSHDKYPLELEKSVDFSEYDVIAAFVSSPLDTRTASHLSGLYEESEGISLLEIGEYEEVMKYQSGDLLYGEFLPLMFSEDSFKVALESNLDFTSHLRKVMGNIVLSLNLLENSLFPALKNCGFTVSTSSLLTFSEESCTAFTITYSDEDDSVYDFMVAFDYFSGKLYINDFNDITAEVISTLSQIEIINIILNKSFTLGQSSKDVSKGTIAKLVGIRKGILDWKEFYNINPDELGDEELPYYLEVQEFVYKKENQ